MLEVRWTNVNYNKVMNWKVKLFLDLRTILWRCLETWWTYIYASYFVLTTVEMWKDIHIKKASSEHNSFTWPSHFYCFWRGFEVCSGNIKLRELPKFGAKTYLTGNRQVRLLEFISNWRIYGAQEAPRFLGPK